MGEISIETAAELTGYSKGHIRRLADSGKIESRRIGKRVIVVTQESVERYAQEMRLLGTSKHARQS